MATHATPLKIGIIDSGISLAFMQATAANVVAGANFSVNWEQKKLHSVYYDSTDIAHWCEEKTNLEIDDRSGHGTAVASIIFRNIKRPIEFYIAKILDEQQSGSAVALLSALHWLVNEIRADLVNLSLGTNNWQAYNPMQELVKQAQQNNCKLFSAAGNIPTLPSELEDVTAVGIPTLEEEQKEPIKLDCIALEKSVTIFRGHQWHETEITTSYACPLILAEHCNSF